VAFVAGVYAISQQIRTDSQPSASAPTEAVVDTVEPYAGPNGLSEAYAAGKLDAGLNPKPGETSAGSEPAPEVVVITGQGSLYDALIEGKYDVDFLSGASGAHYVLGPETAAAFNGLTEALAAGKLDVGFAPQRSEAFGRSGSAPEIVVIEGQGALYDALIEGKYNLGFASGDPGVRYVRSTETATGASGLSEAFSAGKLDAGLNPVPGETSAGAEIAPEIVVIEGQGGLYDALIEGKYDVGFLSVASDVRYALGSGAATNSSGLRSAFAAGQLAEGIGDQSSVELAPAAAGTPTVSGGHQE
jgi:hypothetical protein